MRRQIIVDISTYCRVTGELLMMPFAVYDASNGAPLLSPPETTCTSRPAVEIKRAKLRASWCSQAFSEFPTSCFSLLEMNLTNFLADMPLETQHMVFNNLFRY